MTETAKSEREVRIRIAKTATWRLEIIRRSRNLNNIDKTKPTSLF